MSDSLVFMMGNHEAQIPQDRRYTKSHMWGQTQNGVLRFGFSAYAIRLIQDVYFLDWTIEADIAVVEKQEIGELESKKAESGLFAPISGHLTQFNDELMSDPSVISTDTYQSGWLFEIQGDESLLLSPQAYLEHLANVWTITQRIIKGQVNQ